MSETERKSRPFRLKVWGENACFTRPEMKVERVSYDVLTPSAARGILEAILWKPAICWHIIQIDVLKPIRWESVRRNEVGSLMSDRTNGIFIEDKRQQRAGLLLRDVAYTIHAYFEITEKAESEDTLVKFQEMFLRRAKMGQRFHQPYLGCREFAAHFEPITNNEPMPVPISESRELGYMLHDISHDNTTDRVNHHLCTDKCTSHFFRAVLEDGRMKVPPLNSPEVRS
ncbi:MAG: type I-C CRISPR-associated protein Cas5 [Nitrospirae bacterium]|nr:type I-C CRISPR-associated protein Cas5 [Nitrospirota bacterium]